MPFSFRPGSLCLVLPVFALAATPLLAQSVPAGAAPTPVPGFHFPTVGGSLDYSVTASESVLFGYNGQANSGAESLTSVSGDLAYLSKSERHPLSAIYSGGYLFGTTGEPSYAFQNLSLSQVIRSENWQFVVADSVNYLPQTPVTGLSGIPGVGDLGLNSAQLGLTDGLGILTTFGTRITNTASGTLSRDLTGSTTLSGTGSFALQRFIDSASPGINNDEVSGSGTLTHRFDALTSGGISYIFADSSLNGPNLAQPVGFKTQSILGNFTRQLSRKLNLELSAGPQFVSSTGNTATSSSSTSVAATGTLSYSGRVYTSYLNFSRGVNNGAGVVVGSRSNIVTASIARQFGRAWGTSAEVGYNGSTTLPNSLFPSFSTSAVVAGVQGSRLIGRYLSAYASYTLQRQLFAGTATGLNAFNGLTQVLGFGLTYSPRAYHGR